MQMFNRMSVGETLATVLALIAAAVSPLAFSVSASGLISMHRLGVIAILPALLLWVGIAILAVFMSWQRLARSALLAIFAGILAAVALEVVRIIGFRVFGAMPGSMPMLMGVQLADRFMDGPNLWSNLLGWGDHAWNGIGFAFVYIIILGRMRWWVAVLYAWLIATTFMLSPVMNLLGVGVFGYAFAPIKFPLTVYLAHTAFGATLGGLVQWSRLAPRHIAWDLFGLRLGSAERIVVPAGTNPD